MSNEKIIRFATFNVGDFSGVDMKHGSEESRKAYKAVMEKVGADLWFLQEDYRYFNEETKEKAFDAVDTDTFASFAIFERVIMINIL